jgi:hypothetical protein
MTQDIIKLSELDFDQMKIDLIKLSKEFEDIHPIKWKDISKDTPPYNLKIEPNTYNEIDKTVGFCLTITSEETKYIFPIDVFLNIEETIENLKEDYKQTVKKIKDQANQYKERNKSANEIILKQMINNNLEFATQYIQSLNNTKE